MELARQSRRRLQVPRFSMHLQLPLYLRLMFGVMIIVLGTLLLTRLMPPPTNLFSDFGYLFADDAYQIALARGFRCGVVNLYSHLQTIDYCEVQITHEMFSQISLGILGNDANEISFLVREHTLTVGDLATLWGKPEFRQYHDIVVAAWPTQQVAARASAPQYGRISYFLPVVQVSFKRGGNPRWALLLIMENLPMPGRD